MTYLDSFYQNTTPLLIFVLIMQILLVWGFWVLLLSKVILSGSGTIDKVASNMARGLSLSLLRSLSVSVSRKVLLCKYFAHVHSHIAYGQILWSRSSYTKKIFVPQKQTARIIFLGPGRAHCSRDLFFQLRVVSLPPLYVLLVLPYIKDILLSLAANTDEHDHFTRQNKDLTLNRCKYIIAQSSFV